MDSSITDAVRGLLRSQRVASLGTLHAGEPFVSMVPYAIAPSGGAFLVHVSALAAHTKDMLAEARVSLMVMAALDEAGRPQALPRVTIQADAARLDDSDDEYAAARAAYLARFPDSEPMFGFGDFSLFALRPRAVRYVGGFAQAKSLTPETLAKILAA